MKKRIMTRNGTYHRKKNIAIGIMFLLIWASFVPLIGAANQTIPQRHNHQLSQADTHGLKDISVSSIIKPDHVRKNSTVPTHDIQVNHVRTHEPRKRLALPEQLRVSNNVYQDSTIISKSQDGEVFPLGSNPQVHNNRTNEYFNTIQAAINDANTANGDAIWVNSTDFTENVKVNKSVVLHGRNTGSGLPRLNAGHGIGFNITVNNVTICRFNISNATYGISCDESFSGFSVVNNTFWNTTLGVLWSIFEAEYNADYTVYDTTIRSNEFFIYSVGRAIYANITLNYDGSTGNTVDIGNVDISDNMMYINNSIADGIDFGPISVSNISDSDVSIGTVSITGNTIYNGSYGVNFISTFPNYMGTFTDLNSVNLDVGTVNISNNILYNQSSYGLVFDYYFGYNWSGTTTATFGNGQIQNNTITNASSGIRIYYGDWYNFTDTASITVGDLTVEDNIIENASIISIDFEAYGIGGTDGFLDGLTDNSSVIMGDFTIGNNTITTSVADSEGIYIENEYWGTYMYNNASCEIGSFQVIDNTIVTNAEGIYICSLSDFGEENSGHSVFSMGDINFSGNTITSDADSIYFDEESVYDYGYDLSENASVTIGNFLINDNTLISAANGIYFADGMYDFGESLSENATFSMGDFQMNHNTITSDDDGIFIENIMYIGYELADNSSVVFGSFTFDNNTINCNLTHNGIGIHFGVDGWDDDFGVQYFGCSLSESSSFTMGDFEINGNNINSPYDGILLEGYNYDYDDDVSLAYFGSDITDSSAFIMGNITFNHNTIDCYQDGDAEGCGIDVSGLYAFGYDMYGTSSYTMGNVQFNNNIINSYYDCIYVNYIKSFGRDLGEEGSEDAVSFTMGSITFNENDIDSYEYSGIDIDRGFSYIGRDVYGSSSFTMKDIQFNDNDINSIYDGIYIDEIYGIGEYLGTEDSSDTVTFIMGNITFNGNTIDCYQDGDADSESVGIDFYYDGSGISSFGDDMYGSSSFEMSNLQFNDNIIDSYYDGIYLYEATDFGTSMYDNTSFIMGDFTFNGNDISSYYGYGIDISYDEEEGIYEFGYDMYDNSTFVMGDIQFNDNVIDSYDDGIYVYWIGDFGEELGSGSEDAVSFTMGNITFNRNEIDCYQGGDAGGKSIGLDIRSIRFLCSYLDGNSSFTMDDIQLNDNTITSYSDGIYLPEIAIGLVMYTNSTGFMGDISLNNNTIYSDGGDGIFFINTASTLDIGSELHDNSTFSVNNIELRNNNITNAYDDGMWVAALGVGYDIEDDAVFTLDSFMIANNTITDSDTGLHIVELDLSDWRTPVITNNTVTGCNLGIHVQSSDGNLIYNNYFNNTINAQDDGENTWNVTKISGANIIGGSYLGGNYWSDYDGVDQDSDGLGDTLTPYNSSGDIETDGDFHPLINITVVESGNNGGGTSSNQAPIAHAGGPYSGYVNHTISFSGSGSTDDTSVVGYRWDFTNDGIYDTGWLTTSTTTHTYSTAGTYTVNLQVKDGAGLTDTDTATVTITAASTQAYPPVAHAGGPYSGLTFQDISFVGSGSTDDGAIISYAWSFGDGTTGTGVTALHRYTTTGVFTIILIVTDNDGFTNTSTTTATITLDSDGDGISDAVEEQLGSNPDNASGVVPLVIAGTSDYLVDTNGDGILDTFYNTQTGTHSTTKLQADGTYLIDVNGDGTWEYIYDPAYGTTTAYKKESPGGFPWLIVGIILAIIAIIVLVVVVLVKKRRL